MDFDALTLENFSVWLDANALEIHARLDRGMWIVTLRGTGSRRHSGKGFGATIAAAIRDAWEQI